MNIDPNLSTRLNEIAGDIASIAEKLDEISFDVLREASSEGRTRPEVDKILTQARRALEKALHLLERGA